MANSKEEKFIDMGRETVCVNNGRQQVSLQENRVNDRKEIAVTWQWSYCRF